MIVKRVFELEMGDVILYCGIKRLVLCVMESHILLADYNYYKNKSKLPANSKERVEVVETKKRVATEGYIK